MNQIQSAAPAAIHADAAIAPRAVDSTLDERQLAAYNAAFTELGLRFRWDREMFAWLCGIECEQSRIARYIEQYHAHLLKAYDAEFLSRLIFDKKCDYLRAMASQAN
ncbi:LysR family transcriptional regulator [Cupriavidus sp. 2TAF22]|uniref:LysR family transcriptional regulator n=1 Tax=unclassified Cupriavidus TaxID=2640874 RepID=UPI003F8DA0E6